MTRFAGLNPGVSTSITASVFIQEPGPKTGGDTYIWKHPRGTPFMAKLHSRPCHEEAGGSVYQDPFRCPSAPDGSPGCTADQVAAAAASGTPLEATMTAPLSFVEGGTAVLNFALDWAVNIPAYFNGQAAEDLSLVIYDPVESWDDNGNIVYNPTRMACANLDTSETMHGLVFEVNKHIVGKVPTHDVTQIKRSELGRTDITVKVANLRPDSVYPAYVHALPCIADHPIPRYFRNIECIVRSGSPGCAIASESQFHLRLAADSSGVTDGVFSFDGVASAAAQSIILNDCLDTDGQVDPSGECAGGEPFMMCIDMLSTLPLVASSSSTENPGLAATTEDAPPPTAPPTSSSSSDPCTSISCDAPPNDCHAVKGICTDGICRYGFKGAGVTCNNGGVCDGAGVCVASTTTTTTTTIPTTTSTTTTTTTSSLVEVNSEDETTEEPRTLDDEVDRKVTTTTTTTITMKPEDKVVDASTNVAKGGKNGNPCGYIHYTTTKKRGKVARQRMEYIEGSCCLDATPPEGMRMFGVERDTYHEELSLASMIGIIAGVAGSLMIVVAGVMVRLRRTTAMSSFSSKRYGTLGSENATDEEKEGYALPNRLQLSPESPAHLVH